MTMALSQRGLEKYRQKTLNKLNSRLKNRLKTGSKMAEKKEFTRYHTWLAWTGSA